MNVTLLAAHSLDGFITKHAQPGTAFTSAADKAHFPAVLRDFDCSIMGGETYRVSREFIQSHLTASRRRVVLTRTPDRYQADARERTLEFTADSPAAVLARLQSLGHRRCALLGGSRIHSLFLDAKLVDELWLTVEPCLFGRGTPFLAEQADLALELISHERLTHSDSLLLRYRVQR